MVSRWTSVSPSVRPSACRPSICFSFPDDNLSKHQRIFTKFGMCLGMWYVLMGKFRLILMELSARDTPIFSFLDDNLSKR